MKKEVYSYLFLLFLISWTLFLLPNPTSAYSNLLSENFSVTTYMDAVATTCTNWGDGGLEIPKLEYSLAGVGASGGYDFGVFVVGDIAYVADATIGLQIVNISDVSSPSYVNLLDFSVLTTYDVVVQGDYAYTANELDGMIVSIIKIKFTR